jgi:putative hydrolase of the HAD superfamily
MPELREGRKIRAVVFDLDNTLTDFMKAKRGAIRAAADAMIDAGLVMDPQLVYDRIFAIYDEVGIEHQRVFNRFLTAWMDTTRRRGGSPRPRAAGAYPHVQRVVYRLVKDGYKLAVVSDAPRIEAWLRLCYLGLQHVFDVVLTHDDTGARKPDPVPFRMALERLGVAPGQAVMVGDWPERDIAGGLVAGLHTVYARYGDTYGSPDRPRNEDSGAHFVIDDLLQLLDVLERLERPAGEA